MGEVSLGLGDCSTAGAASGGGALQRMEDVAASGEWLANASSAWPAHGLRQKERGLGVPVANGQKPTVRKPWRLSK